MSMEINPSDLVKQFRENYVNAHALKKRNPQAHPKANISTRKQAPLKENDLPQGVRSLLTEYRQSHPGAKVTLLKYQRLENGEPVRIVEDEDGLPDDDQLLNLSQTVTLTTSREVRVITEMVVARVESA